MVDRSVFDRRLAKLEELLQRLRLLTTQSRESFHQDPGLQAQAERWTHLLIECALDLSNHMIADRGWPAATTNREVFRVLADRGVIGQELAERLRAWAGLRNILVHLYLEVDHGLLYDILNQDLGEIESFAQQIVRAADDSESC